MLSSTLPLAIAYFYRAIAQARPVTGFALNNLGNQKEDARLDFQHALKLYLNQLKRVKISPQEKNEALFKLETIEHHLKLLQS